MLGNTVLPFALCRMLQTKLHSDHGRHLSNGKSVIFGYHGPTIRCGLLQQKLISNNLGCQVNGYFIHTLSRASILIMATTRYYCVLKLPVYRRLLAFCWLGGFACCRLCPGKDLFEPSSHQLQHNFSKSNSQVAYTLYAVFFDIVFCLGITCCYYNRVSWFIRQHNANTGSLTTQEINLSQALFELIFSFVILWVQIYIFIILFRMILQESLFPREIDLAATFLNHISCTINPWIYGVMSPLIRKKMKNVLFRPRQLPRVSPEAANTTHRVHVLEEMKQEEKKSILKHDSAE